MPKELRKRGAGRMTEAERNLQELPFSWEWTRIGDILEPSKERADPSEIEEIAYIGLEHIEKDTGKLLGHGKSSEVRSSKAKFFEGDLLYGKLRPYLNKVYFADFDGVCSTDILVFPKNEYISNKYLLFRFLQEDFVKYANQNASGVQHPRVDFKKLANFRIPIAPLPEQRRIVARIEELFSRLDAGVEALQKAKTRLRCYRQAVLKAAMEGRLTEQWRKAHPEVEPAEKLLALISKERRCFWEHGELAKMLVKGERQKNNKWKNKYKEPEIPKLIDLPELPESWAWATVDQLSAYERNSITDGPFGSNLKTSHYTSSGPRVIRLQNIGKGEFIDEKAHVSDDHFKKLKKHAVYPGDIVIAALGNPAPRACLIPEWIGDAIVKADCIRLKVVEEKISGQYVMYSLNSFPTQKRAEEIIHGVGRPRLNLGEIKNIVVPLPPIEEQKIISEEIERSFSIADKVEDIIEANIKRSKFLRQFILKRAFEGSLVPQDPSDEPASILLKRILEEKAKRKRELKPFKRVNRREATMPRIRFSLHVVLVEAKTQLTPQELFYKAGFTDETIDEFYQELREEVNKLRIIEIRPNEVDVYLKVVENENK